MPFGLWFVWGVALGFWAGLLWAWTARRSWLTQVALLGECGGFGAGGFDERLAVDSSWWLRWVSVIFPAGDFVARLVVDSGR